MSSIQPRERALGFLITDVARLLRRNFERRVAALGLTQAQWRALAQLAREEGLKHADLAERLEIKPISLTRLVDRMEEAGWVRRAQDASDRRASRLYLTEKCQPVLDEMRARAAETVEEAFDGLSERRRAEVITALERIKHNLAAAESAARAAHGKDADDGH